MSRLQQKLPGWHRGCVAGSLDGSARRLFNFFAHIFGFVNADLDHGTREGEAGRYAIGSYYVSVVFRGDSGNWIDQKLALMVGPGHRGTHFHGEAAVFVQVEICAVVVMKVGVAEKP